jgi:hypothetical protein
VICWLGKFVLLSRQVDGRIELAVHEDLIDVDLHFPDALAPHPAPVREVLDALRHAGGVCAGAQGNLVLPHPAPPVLVGIATQGGQDADMQRLKPLIIEGGCRNGGEAAQDTYPMIWKSPAR